MINVNNFLEYCNFKNSVSQKKQDLLALYIFNEKRNGFFVEFGACDGIIFSNTFMLEADYGWNGILAEPAFVYQEDLIKNRSCHIDTNCVYSETGKKLVFNECDASTLSTILKYSDNDWAVEERKKGKHYEVNTISLDDLLKKYNAPRQIDYMSIDTEGSEFDILNSFSFDWDIKLFTIEHNYTSMREEIFDLMSSRGYTRILQEISAHDDWYVKE